MADFKWFLENYQALYEQYGHKYLVIMNQDVIGVYNSIKDAMDNTHEEQGSYIIQECNGNESAYTNYISSWNFA